MPNWANAKVLENDLGFGRDLEVIKSTIRSLCFYFNKYQPGSLEGNSEELIFASTRSAWKVAFSEEMLRIWGLDGQKRSESTQIILDTMVSYFNLQQKSSVNYARGEVSQAGWIWPLISAGTNRSGQAVVLDAVQQALRQESGASGNKASQADLSMLTADRFLQPRASLMRDVLQQKIANTLATMTWSNVETGHGQIRELIQTSTDESRRHWRRLPAELAVLGHIYRDGSTILECVHRLSKVRSFWFEGPMVGSHPKLFSAALLLAPERMADVIYAGKYWNLIVDVVDFKERNLSSLGIEINVPPMTVNYRAMAC